MSTLRTISLSFLLATGLIAGAQQKVIRVSGKEEAIAPTAVTDIGGFEGNRIDKNQQNYLHTFPIDKYAGLMETRNFTGWDWRQGEQPGKWLESAIITAARTHDIALEKEARSMYERLLKSQAPDGYIGITSQTVRTPEKPLGGMDAYELYFLEHALLTAYEIWKDPTALQAAKKLGDYFLRYIGPGKAEFWPSPIHDPENKGKTLKGTMHSDIAGHSIHYSWEGTLLIDPLMRLYQLSADKRYYDWCRWVVNSIDKWSGWDSYSNLDKVAAGEMPIDKIQPYVHAHTFQMNFLGLLRMYQVSGDSSYLRKVIGAWKDIAARQLYITGGVSVGEHYERDFVKPLTGEMMETCATMSWMQLSQALLDLTGDPRYADAIERIQWNNVFAEQTIDGDANHYFTPPNGYTPKGYFREPDCCMSSGERLLSILPGFIYASGPQQKIFINQFVSSTTAIGKTRITQQTNFPADTTVEISIDPVKPASFTVGIRIPAWVTHPTLTVNGKTIEDIRPGSYAAITRTWRAGDKLTLILPMKLQWVPHEHYLKTTDRKPYKTTEDNDPPYALVRGPVVYAVDDIWYKGDTAIFGKGWMDSVRYIVTDAKQLHQLPSPGKDVLGPSYEVQLLLANGNKTTIPVYPFANIGKWYRDPAHKPDSNSAAWTYAIWLKMIPDAPEHVSGALSLPYIFGNNMVFQRDTLIPIWGNARAGAAVRIDFNQQTKTTTADARGRWRLNLDPIPASFTPGVMRISSDSATVIMRNILVGEVWLCSGQSNMEYSMRKNSKFEKAAHGSGPPDELENAHNPYIRTFLVRTNYSKPDNHIRREWDTAEGAPLRDFSAAGYFFAKELYSRLHVPIGMISNAVSGSRIEPWLPGDGPDSTGKFYETLVRPLAPYQVKGFLWYQGESNCFLNDTLRYPDKMKTLIDSWRTLWEDQSLPFYFVQIAPFYYSHSTGGNQSHTPTAEAAFWAAQEKALQLPHTGMVVTTDLVDSLQDLHPAYKWEIGRRLALWALGKDYKENIVYSGPTYQSMTVKGKTITITFANTGTGLVSQDGKPLSWFETAGKDGKFSPASAVITGDDKITLTAKQKPITVRFGWNETAQPNLFNSERLPAMPFEAMTTPPTVTPTTNNDAK